ncbi:MAG: hypothetical protein AB4062_16000 [Crocosphaera sp.]
MPDGDKIHDKLWWGYQKPYKELCEGKSNVQECAWTIMESLLKNIKRNGDIPLQIAQLMEESINQASLNIGNCQNLDWRSLRQHFDRLVQQFNLSHYLKETVLRAGKKVLHDLRYARPINGNSPSEAIVTQYFYELYQYQFRDRIPLTHQHHAGIDHRTLEEKITSMEAEIVPVFSKWGQKADKEGTVTKLRRPRRKSIESVDLQEDLL